MNDYETNQEIGVLSERAAWFEVHGRAEDAQALREQITKLSSTAV